MTQPYDFEIIRNKLRGKRPPNDILLIEEVAQINWGQVNHTNIEAASEILLRISADVIVCAHDLNGEERQRYKILFMKISNNIMYSGILEIYQDLKEYFRKYELYMVNLGP